MRKLEDKKNLTHGFAFSVGIGIAVGFLSILVIFAIFAAIIASGKISDSMMLYITVSASLAGSLIGSIAAVKRFKGKIMTVSLSVGALMFLITLIGSAFSENGALIGRMTPILFLTFILGGIIGGFLNVKRKKHKHA